MELIYQNFDGLDVSFEGALPLSLLDQLTEAQLVAKERKGDVPIKLGPEALAVMIAETGSKGGYRYRFNTGPDGETWFIAHSSKLNKWNIRVSTHSLALALYGYEGVKNRILDRLGKLEAQGSLKASISRFDYCFDLYTTDDFMPDATHFIAHKNCKKSRRGEKDVVSFFDSATGERVETLMVGKMPGRQATIYNKTQEIKASSKQYWRDIWQLDNRPPGTVWRVEVRAGKDELNKWGVKTFAELELKVGDIILDILHKIRYVTPTSDSNRARWPMAAFWQACVDHARQALAPYISNANREAILREQREAVANRYATSIQGSLIGYAAVQGRDISEIPGVMHDLEKAISQNFHENPQKFLDKFRQAEEKFAFLE